MNDNEMELLRMIREHDEPEKALEIAVEVITSFLTENEPAYGVCVCKSLDIHEQMS